MRRQNTAMSDSPAKKEGEPGSPEGKTFTTKAEYHRWLIQQEKWATAESIRQSGKEGEEMIKERQRKHTTAGLTRQQAAAVQMKKASESLEAHRERNLTMGRQVYEEVSGWRTGAKEQKDKHQAKVKAMRDKVREDQNVQSVRAEFLGKKKEIAAATREDDQKKETANKNQKEAELERKKKMAEVVRTETSATATDAAKRFFYEQRLASAAATKSEAVIWERQRKEESEAFNQKQVAKRTKAKTARAGAGKSRAALMTARAEEAIAMREQKKALAEEHKKRLQDDYQLRMQMVKGVVANLYVQPEVATGEPGSPGHTPISTSYYSITNIRPASPERGGSTTEGI